MIKLFASSVNKDKLSLTFKGLIPLIIFLGMIKGVQITETELNDVIQNAIVAIGTIGGAISAIIAAYGAGRKVVVKFKGKK